jgi:hypothetical protein
MSYEVQHITCNDTQCTPQYLLQGLTANKKPTPPKKKSKSTGKQCDDSDDEDSDDEDNIPQKKKKTTTPPKKKSKSTGKQCDDSDDEDNGPQKKKKTTPAKLKESYVLQVADLATLEGLCIGVSDSAPHSPPRRQFMYWSAKLPSAACLMLIQRYKIVCMSRDVVECHDVLSYAM